MSYTENSGAIINLLPYSEYESKHWSGELTEGQAWIPTDLVNAIPSYNTNLKQKYRTINSGVSSYSSMVSGEMVYIKSRSSEVSISLERVSPMSTTAYIYTVIAEVGSNAYTVRLVDLHTESEAVLKWRNGDTLYNSNNRIQLQANKTYIITIINGLASYEIFS